MRRGNQRGYRRTNEPVEVCVDIIQEKDLSWYVTDGTVKCYLPKSQIMTKDINDKGTGGEFVIPRWLAEEKGLV
jgi:hypothetical protein